MPGPLGAVMNAYANALRYLAFSMGLKLDATEAQLAEALRYEGWPEGTDDKVLNDVLALPEFQRKMAEYERYLASPDFLSSFEWRKLRMVVLTHYGARCQCCGATPDDGVVMNVDHIKPRRTYPWLALEFENLQVLCNPCNHGKSNWDTTDWRPACVADAYIAH
jgi:5-methylcytosine-specific restriction endonuclease McrA